MKVVLSVGHAGIVSAIVEERDKIKSDFKTNLAYILALLFAYLLLVASFVWFDVFNPKEDVVNSLVQSFITLSVVGIIVMCGLHIGITDIAISFKEYKEYNKLLSFGVDELHKRCLKDTDIILKFRSRFELYRKLSKLDNPRYKSYERNKDGGYKIVFKTKKGYFKWDIDDISYSADYDEITLLIGENSIDLKIPIDGSKCKRVELIDLGGDCIC